MTVYYSKGHTSSGSPLAFQTPANWNTEDDATGSDATTLAGHHLIVQASHYMTLGADVACGSVRLLGTLTGNDNTITTDRATSNKPFDHDGTISGDLNVTITNTGVQADGLMLDSGHGNTGNINDLTINMANGTTANKTIGIAETCTLDGDLTITSGTFDTVFSGGSSQTLTVTGQVSVTGTLTCNESAINIGSLYITSNGVVNATNQTTTINKETSVSAVGYAVYNEGTFHHNNGLVVIGTDTSTIVYGMEGDDTSGANSNAFYRVQVELDNAAYFCKFRPQAGTVAVKIANDLTVAEGIVSQETATHSFEVDVDVSIEAGGVLGRTDITGANTFGSLTIASSGEYIATSGTTEITSAASNYAVTNNGTLTHNDGTFQITGGSNQWLRGTGSGAYYNLISNNGSSLGMGVGANLSVANDLTINTQSDRQSIQNTGFTRAITGDQYRKLFMEVDFEGIEAAEVIQFQMTNFHE